MSVSVCVCAELNEYCVSLKRKIRTMKFALKFHILARAICVPFGVGVGGGKIAIYCRRSLLCY